MKLSAILLTGLALLCGGIQASAVDVVLVLDLTNKTVEVDQTIAIRENVYTEIRGIGDSASTNLTLRISLGTTTYASASSFTNYGTNASSAVGYVDLNTSEFTNFFAGAQATLKRSFSIAVWDTVLAKLLLNDTVEIQNNPYVEGMPDPSPVGVTYMQLSVTGANWQVRGGNLQLWDTVDELFRDVYFRQGSIVAGYTNAALIGGGPTNYTTPELMGIMLDYAIPNPSHGHIAYYDADGKWKTASPGTLLTTISWGDIIGTITNQADLQAELDAKADDSDVTAIDARVTAVEGQTETNRLAIVDIEAAIITNVYAQAGADNNAELVGQEVVVTFKETGDLYRYAASTETAEEIYVVATSTNVTAARVGTVVTLTIPENTVLLSIRGRWPANVLGDSFTLVLGTNDMDNTGFANRWGALFQAYYEGTGALLPGAAARLDLTNHDRLEIQGFDTRGINHYRISF